MVCAMQRRSSRGNWNAAGEKERISRNGPFPSFFSRCRSVVRFAIPVVLLTGCSTLGVKIDSRPEVTQQRQTRHLLASLSDSSRAAESLRLAQSPGLKPGERLALLLTSAEAALPQALQGRRDALEIYHSAVAQAVTVLMADRFANRTASGPLGSWQVEVVRKGTDLLDPLQAGSLLPAASVRITGLTSRSLQPGIGVPYVFSYPEDSPFLAGQPGIPPIGIATPATAVLSFKNSRARLSFIDTLRSDQVRLNNARTQVAADFSAPIAVLLARGKNRSIDLHALLFTQRRLDDAGLFQFQPYDPTKIPVVFVHGLFSRPEAWTQALNGLLADPEIRQHYQFWFLLYPTGLPIWKSAALLRSEMDRFHHELERDRHNPNLRRTVLIGHSMGGLVASLVVRQGGDKLWSQFSDTQVERLNISPKAQKVINRLIYFAPRDDISRVIFVATPHRGSRLAFNPVAGLISRLIQLPRLLDRNDRLQLQNAARDDVRNLFSVPTNSIRFLKADSPLILSIQKLPLARAIPYHSIIGDRGRGDSPHSSDGVVPYSSSHLESAQSEKIVPSGHGANEHPEAVEEMRKILLKAIGEKGRRRR